MEDDAIPLYQWPSLTPRTILLSYALFPQSSFDAEQFLNLLEMRSETGLQSELVRMASNGLKKRRGRGAMAGIVALCYKLLRDKGRRISLESASILASEVGYGAGKGVVLGGGDRPKVENFAMDADPANVRKIFREYRSVAHIWAAELCCDLTGIDDAVSFQRSNYARQARAIQLDLESILQPCEWQFMDLGQIIRDVSPNDWHPKRGPMPLIELTFERLSGNRSPVR